MKYTIEHDDFLRECRSTMGLSHAVTADAFSKRFFPITRNAVMQRCRRIGVRGGGRASAPQGRVKRPLPRGVRLPLRPGRTAFADLKDHQCRYAPDTVAEGFCGKPITPGSPYCAAHLQLCTRSPVVTQREDAPATERVNSVLESAQ